MRLRRFFVIVTLCFNLTVVVFTQDSPASTQRQELICRDSWVEWPSFVSDRGVLLVVSGPQGLYVKRSHPAGEWPRFSLLDDEGRPRPDGIYKWEVVGQAAAWGDAGPASPLKSEVQSGWFEIRAGKAVSEQTAGEKWPITVEAEAPENSIRVDREGRVGVGTSVPGAKLHVKGADPGLAIEDTQPGGHEYVLRSHESGDGSLGLFDETKGEARWLVDGEGRIGINTTQPTSTFTVDGYVESTKGFLVNGRPLTALGGFVGSQPLATETNSNNFFGTGAGGANTSGYANSFFGGVAGASNTTGYANSFFGRFAGYANTEGGANSFYGMNAGQYNSVGNCNSFFGASAGFANTEGSFNSFFGGGAGFANTTGHDNSFFGRSTGDDNTTGSYNSFFGVAAGNINQSGTRITALGYLSGGHNTVEPNNTFLGAHADLDPGTSPGTTPVTNATAIGYRAYVSQSNSLVLGGVRGFNAVTTETLVGIGTTSPDRQLVVEGSQAIGKFRRYNDTTAGHAPAFLFERARGTSTNRSRSLRTTTWAKCSFGAALEQAWSNTGRSRSLPPIRIKMDVFPLSTGISRPSAWLCSIPGTSGSERARRRLASTSPGTSG
ncbi:MAG: hypothetical protein EHM61_05070 [Acidobacteria bacterium]|nr:MAG: hypothetical protein EHM61_05070 [Acidobacteriota bacterium]